MPKINIIFAQNNNRRVILLIKLISRCYSKIKHLTIIAQNYLNVTQNYVNIQFLGIEFDSINFLNLLNANNLINPNYFKLY